MMKTFPRATEESRKNGWILNYDLLENIDYELKAKNDEGTSMEVIEDLILILVKHDYVQLED